ncbi:MAG: hypothetical protein KF681_07815 [Bdellovibrionaceae bacterium]|nr:hypothetical protein [Pseudobdellovibrionaceae bacterium]
MRLILIFMSLFASISLASSPRMAAPVYKLKIDLSLEGRPASSFGLVVTAGERARISENVDGQETFIEVLADRTADGGVDLQFLVGQMSKKGERLDLGRPRIVARENIPASITVGDDGGEQMSLAVLAQKHSR